MSTVTMSVSDWIKVRDNPIQRDTERHAAKAKHLLTPLPIHAITFAAKLPSGELVKLDGHTRALLWKRNLVRHPHKVTVNVLDAESIEDAVNMYKTLDAKEALESASDKVTGGYRLTQFEPQSSLLATANITYGLRLAFRGLANIGDHEARTMDIYPMVEEFAPELAGLDSFMLRPGDVNTAIIAAFLLTTRKHGDAVGSFWRGFFGDGGTRADGKMDGIQALKELGLYRSKRKMFGGSAALDYLSRALTAVEKWLAKEDLKDFPRPMQFAGYAAHSRPASRLIKRMALQDA